MSTVRSSACRRVTGLSGERYWVCNGRAVPLTPDRRQGEHVAGVRFKAWQPVSEPASDDRRADAAGVRSGRSLEQALDRRLHLSRRPSGRAQLRAYPVNSNEAEGRRLSRFVPFGHRIGTYDPPLPEYNRHFPATLDLRRARD
jgi:uncharacterized protein (DUF2126 family)